MLWQRIFAIAREAASSAKSQPVASVVSIVIIAGMCLTVLLTTGRTVGAERAVLGSIDSAGTRSIVIRADTGSGLNTDVLDRLSNLEGVAWFGGFGQALDAHNIGIQGGANVPVRHLYGPHTRELGISHPPALPTESAFASTIALRQLGMTNAAGSILVDDGRDYSVTGQLTVPSYLKFLEPLVVIPTVQAAQTAPDSLTLLVIVASRPQLVSPLSRAVVSMLGLDDPSKVKISTSESLATLRSLIEAQLSASNRSLILGVFAVSIVLVASILYGLVMLRRKDFGRRRALGASRGLIVTLLLVQMAILGVLGATLGSFAAVIGLLVSRDPLPGLDFFAAVGILATVTGVVAALAPAILAARRDPLKELRVP